MARLNPMLRFFLSFLGVLLALFGISIIHGVQQYVVLPWTAALAKICAVAITLFDVNATALGKVLWNPSNGFGVSIEPGCNGIDAYLVLVAAVVAFPSTWKHRMWGLILGFVVVQGVNVLRIISLFYLGQWSEAAFQFAHLYLWQGLIMLDVLVFWLFWVRAGFRRNSGSRGTPFEPINS